MEENKKNNEREKDSTQNDLSDHTPHKELHEVLEEKSTNERDRIFLEKIYECIYQLLDNKEYTSPLERDSTIKELLNTVLSSSPSHINPEKIPPLKKLIVLLCAPVFFTTSSNAFFNESRPYIGGIYGSRERELVYRYHISLQTIIDYINIISEHEKKSIIEKPYSQESLSHLRNIIEEWSYFEG